MKKGWLLLLVLAIFMTNFFSTYAWDVNDGSKTTFPPPSKQETDKEFFLCLSYRLGGSNVCALHSCLHNKQSSSEIE